jgi:hypothetical protein
MRPAMRLRAPRTTVLTTTGVLLLAAAASGVPACGSVSLGDTPGEFNACRPDVDLFVSRVWPEFLARYQCRDMSGCHDADNGRSPFRLRDITSPAPPAGTARTLLPPDWSFNYEQATLELDCASPLDSPLLVKPEVGGPSAHGGGDLFSRGGAEDDLFRTWVK